MPFFQVRQGSSGFFQPEEYQFLWGNSLGPYLFDGSSPPFARGRKDSSSGLLCENLVELKPELLGLLLARSFPLFFWPELSLQQFFTVTTEVKMVCGSRGF
jgi:hypothetical protein